MEPNKASETQYESTQPIKGRFLPRSRFTGQDFQRTFTLEKLINERRAVTNRPQDRRSDLSRWGQFNLSTIKLLSTFARQLMSVHFGSFREYGARFDSIRLIAGRKQTAFVGQGYSFSVNIILDRQLIARLLEVCPDIRLEQYEIIAVKIPKVEPVEDGVQ